MDSSHVLAITNSQSIHYHNSKQKRYITDFLFNNVTSKDRTKRNLVLALDNMRPD